MGEIDAEHILQDTKTGIERILQKLKPKLEAGEFEMVLGIDASGRVPALLVAKTISHLRPIETRFVATGRQFRPEEYDEIRASLAAHFRSPGFKLPPPPKKVLIIDDVLIRGTGASLICDALREVGAGYEVAALTVPTDDDWSFFFGAGEEENFESLEAKLQSPITGSGDKVAEIYGKQQMSGVHKGIDSIFSAPLDKDVRHRPSSIPSPGDSVQPLKQDRDVLNFTRRRLNEISDELAHDLGWTRSNE